MPRNDHDWNDCPCPLCARRRRHYDTSKMNKCVCGNVAKLGENQCSRCRDSAETPTIEERLEAIEAVIDDDEHDATRREMILKRLLNER